MSETITKKNTELCKLKLSTDSKRGFEIFIQSSHAFASLFGAADKRTFKLGGVECVVPRGGNESNIPGVAGFFKTGASDFAYDDRLNLSLLLAKELEKGVTFNFGVFPISEDKINEYISRFKEQIKMIYLTYMKPVSVSITFSTCTVETEDHD